MYSSGTDGYREVGGVGHGSTKRIHNYVIFNALKMNVLTFPQRMRRVASDSDEVWILACSSICSRC
jgi:hypothetical protein